jgi:hypothetical protein
MTDRSHRGHTNPLTDPDFFIGFAYYHSSSQPLGCYSRVWRRSRPYTLLLSIYVWKLLNPCNIRKHF